MDSKIPPQRTRKGTRLRRLTARRPARSLAALRLETLEERQLLATVSIAANDPNASELGLDPGQFTITRTGPDYSQPLTVAYQIGGTASFTADYQGLSGSPNGMGGYNGSLMIPAGAASATINVTPVNDALKEGNETLTLTLTGGGSCCCFSCCCAPGGGYTVGSPSAATLTIADNDNWLVSVQADDPAAAEQGADPGRYTVTRSGENDLSNAMTVYYQLGGTAAFGSDYQVAGASQMFPGGPVTGSVTIPAEATSATINVTPVNDALKESGETVTLTLTTSACCCCTPGATYAVGSPSAATVTIADNDDWQVAILPTDASAAEVGGDTGRFTVTRSGSADLTFPLTVSFQVTGSATHGVDYQGIGATQMFPGAPWTGSLTIPAGATSAAVTITPISDALNEGTESVTLTLTSGAGCCCACCGAGAAYTVGSPSSGTVTISDVDAAPQFPASPYSWTVAENAAVGSAAGTVAAVDPQGNAITYSLVSGDYGQFAINAQTGAITVASALNYEARRSYSLLVKASDGTNAGTTTVSIAVGNISEPPTFGQAQYTFSVPADAGYRTLAGTVSATDPNGLPITFASATAWPFAVDPATGQLTVYGIGALAQGASFTFDVTADAGDGAGHATVTVNVTAPANRPPAFGAPSYTFTVPANAAYGSVAGTPAATDPDNQPLGFWADWSWPFGVDSGTGAVVLYATDGLAAGQSYSFGLWVSDGFASRSVPVTVNVTAASGASQMGASPLGIVAGGRASFSLVQPGAGVQALTTGSPSLAGNAEVFEASPYALQLQSNGATMVGWDVDWGDGQVQHYPANATQATHVYADGDAPYTIVVTATYQNGTTGPLEGLSPGYWKQPQHSNAWTTYKPNDNYEAIFGVSNAQKPPKLIDGLQANGGGIKALWRQSVAALLNAAHPNINYKYSVAEVISMVRNAYATGRYDEVKDLFEVENNREADLSSGGTGAQVSVTLRQNVLVRNVPPTLRLTGAAEVTAGNTYVLGLSRSDPGLDTIASWTIQWGDGTTQVVPGNPSSVSHVYESLGNVRITATATDEDGTFAANPLDVRVRGIRLVEGTNFVVDYRKALVLPASPSALTVQFASLAFDGTDLTSINDAFELALVGADGKPLVAMTARRRDAFFNITEGEATLAGAAVQYDAATGRVTIDISHLPGGTAATLIARLVNDDRDPNTSVEINPVVKFVASPFVKPPRAVPAAYEGRPGPVDPAHLADVTPSVAVSYKATSYNDATGLLHAGISVRNAGTYPIAGPLLLGVRNISSTRVSLADADGVTADGMAYYDLSHLAFTATDGTFAPNDVISGVDLVFSNPAKVQFTYELVVLGYVNRAPQFVSTPIVNVAAGGLYRYDSDATDPERDGLTYRKMYGPAQLSVAPGTGLLTWQTAAGDVGTYPVVIRVTDTGGLWHEQSFNIVVSQGLINRPPFFTSAPEVDGFVGKPYVYQATARDPDGDAPLAFSLVSATRASDGVPLTTLNPSWAIVVSTAGLVTWTPPAALVGETVSVVLKVDDGHGGSALQPYTIYVSPEPGNHPPVIISQPSTRLELPQLAQPQVTGGTIGSTGPGLGAVRGQVWLDANFNGVRDQLGSLDGLVQLGPMGPVALTRNDDGSTGVLDLGFTFEFFGGNFTQFYLNNNGNITFNGPVSVYTPDGFPTASGRPMVAPFWADVDTRPIGSAEVHLATGTSARGHKYIQIDWPDVGYFANHVDKLNDFTLYIEDDPDGDIVAFVYRNMEWTTGDASSGVGGFGGSPAIIGFDASDGVNYAVYGRPGSASEIAQFANRMIVFRIDPFGRPLPFTESGIDAFNVELVNPATGAVVARQVSQTLDLDGNGVINPFTEIGLYRFENVQPGNYTVRVAPRDGWVQSAPTNPATRSVVVTANGAVTDADFGVYRTYFYPAEALDPDGDPLTFSLVGDTHGATINPMSGRLDWHPTVPGSYTFTVRVDDGRGGRDEQNFTVIVTTPQPNLAPDILSHGPTSVGTGRTYSYTVRAFDANYDALTYDLLVRPTGMTIDPTTGVVTWTPQATQYPTLPATVPVRVRVRDGRGGEDTEDITITVFASPVNQPPAITSSPVLSAVVGQTYRYDATASDPEGDALSFDLTLRPDGMQIQELHGYILWEPTAAQLGVHQVVLRVRDSQGGVTTQSFEVRVTNENDPPTITSTPTGPAGRNLAWTYQVTAQDPNGDALAYRLDAASLARGMTITTAGLVSWTPAAVGDYRVEIVVDDNRGGTALQSFTLPVRDNAPPQITSTPVGPALVGEVWSYPVVATDPNPGETALLQLTLDQASRDRGITLAGGVVSWTPALVGDYPITVTARDPQGATATQTFTLPVRERVVPSEPPTITSTPTGPAYVNRAWTYTVTATDPDSNDASLVYSLVDPPAGTAGVSFNPTTRVLTWTPSATGSRSFKVRVTDPQGSYAEQSFTVPAVSGSPTNAAPRITSIPTGPAVVGQAYRYQVAAYDPDGDRVNYTVSATPSVTGLSIDANGLLTWDRPQTAGSVAIRVTASDGALSTFQDFTLPVVVPNDGPRITSTPTGPAYVNSAWTYTVTAVDPDGDPATLVYSLTQPAPGTPGVSFNPATRLLTWTPSAVGNRTFTLRVTDTHGAWVEQTFTVPAESAPPANAPPVIRSLPPNPARVGQTYLYPVSAFDPNGDRLTYTLPQAPSGMTIGADGRLTWDPGVAGTYPVTVRVSDGVNAPVDQAFTLSVLPPVAANDPPQITSTPTGPAVRDRVFRYQATAVDPNGDPIQWSLDLSAVPVAARGDLTISTAGLVTWTPRVEGNFNLKVTAGDGQYLVTQTFTLTVLENAPPVITSPPVISGTQGTAYNYPVIASDPNAGDTLRYSLEGVPTGMSISSAGVVIWTTPLAGIYGITVVVADQDDATARQSYSLRISDPAHNSAPEIRSNPRGQIQGGQRFQHQVEAFDADGDPLTYTLVGGPPGMTMDTRGLIDWATTAANISTTAYPYTVRVSDGINPPTSKSFSLLVVSELNNHAPAFTSTPRSNVVAGERYTYDADASDPDGDSLTYSLVARPTGMTIDPLSGLVQWSPTVADLGTHTMTVRVLDALGLGQDQTVTLTVRSTNRPPIIESDPIVQATVNQLYTYDVQASDPDGQRLRYELGSSTNVTGPITIDAGTGLINWTPSGTGTYRIQVNVFDELGLGIAQLFDVQVLTSTPNRSPQITSRPPLVAEAGAVWTYDVDATDPDPGQTPVITMFAPNPLLANMTFTASTGVITWTPPASLIGQLVTFEVRASDGSLTARQWFQVVVHPANSQPSINAIGNKAITAGATLRLDVAATDPDNDPLRYSLDQASRDRGMSIDGYGRITWATRTADISATPYVITVSVTDERTAPVTRTFQVTVSADTQDPSVRIELGGSQAGVGDEVPIAVVATDNVGVASRTLTLVSVTRNGTTTTLNRALTLDDAGRARLALTSDLVGTLTFAATATDVNNRTAPAQPATLLVINPADQSPPTVSLVTPTERQKVSRPVDVIGSVADDQPGVSWTLTAVPLDGGAPVAVAQGSGAVTRGLLGRLDTTRLRNGFYRLDLLAIDSGGHRDSASVTVEVEGELKAGNFSLGFVDLQLPIVGLPITVTRTYDTLQADVQGDFGYGWRLDLSNTKVTVDYGSNIQTGFFGNIPFTDGTRVVITLPDGTEEGFTFYGEQVYQGFIQTPDFLPKFLPDFGVKSELIVDPRYLRRLGDGYIDMETGYDYTPADPSLGGAYTLKLRNGSELVIDARTGDLSTIVDTNGNTLTFSDAGIEHSAGRGLRFERDLAGRITAIITPDNTPNTLDDNPRIIYEYDPAGNLVAVTDRAGSTTRFTYKATPAHYLDQVIDPLGRAVARTEFDADGRIRRVVDAAGKEIRYAFESGGRVQRITDQVGNTTVLETDDRGNLIREQRPEGGITLGTYDTADHLLTSTWVVGQVDSAENGEHDDLVTRYTYYPSGDLETETDPRGVVTRYTYNEFGQLTSTTAGGLTTSSTYDSFGLVRSVRDADGNLTTFEYDDDGNMKFARDADGRTLQSNTYNQYGEILSTSQPTGRTVSFDYNADGKAVASWYFDGQGASQVQVIDYNDFDDAGRVRGTRRIVLPSGQFVTTNLAGTTFAAQYVKWTTSVTFDALGRVETATDPQGGLTEFTYDVRGLVIQIRQRSLDTQGNASWTVTRTAYDDAGRPVVTTDPYAEGTTAPITGMRTTYDKDGRAKLVEQVRGVVIGLVGAANAREAVVTVPGTAVASGGASYDLTDRATVTTDEGGLETRALYNARDEQIESRTQSVDAAGQTVWVVTRMVYDDKGRVVLTTDPYVEGAGAVVYGVRTDYDDRGRAFRSVRLRGIQVDISGGNTVITAGGTEVWHTESVYDNKGRVARTIGADGRTTDYEYDDYGRRTAVIDAPVAVNGQTVRHRVETVFDAEGRVKTVRTNLKQASDGTIDRTAARETTYTYDKNNNVTQTTYTDGKFASATYDEFGRKLRETDRLNHTTNYEYDAEGRLKAVIMPAVPDPDANGALARPRYEYEYDARGNQTLTRDPLGHETRFTFDERDLQLTRTLPLGFGPDGKRGTADDTTLPEGTFAERVDYDDRGRPVLLVTFEGAVVQSIYDARTGRLSARRFFDNLTAYNNGAGTPRETWTYKYDALGREVEVRQDDGQVRTTTETYDAEGRLASVTSPQGSVNYRYDDLGRLVRTFTGTEADPIEDTRYGYDALGRLASVVVYERNNVPLPAAGRETTTYEYDLVGNLDLERKANGVIVDYVYDALDRLDKVTEYAPDATPNNLADNPKLAEFDYTVRDDGLRSGVSETVWFDGNNDGVAEAHATTIAWTYDDMGRLIDEVIDHYDNLLDRTTHYTYDLASNRRKVTLDKGRNGTLDEVTTAVFDANNRLKTEAVDTNNDGQPDRTTTYGYNHTQQTSKEVRQGATLTSGTTFTYDLAGRLAVATVTTYTGGVASRVERTTYDYDADGIRFLALGEVDATADGTFEARTRTEYLNDGLNPTGYSQVLTQTVTDAGTGQLQKRITFVIGLDQVSQTTVPYVGGVAQAAQTYFFLSDGHGSTRLLTGPTGAIAVVGGTRQIFDYDAYGNALGFDPASAATEFLYAGEQFDTRIGLQYLRARYYDPATGRFNQLDPFSGDPNEPVSLHKYLYGRGNPISFLDPSGMCDLISLGISMTVGADNQSSKAIADMKAANDIRRALKILSEIYSKSKKVWDWVNAARNAIDLFQFDPSDIAEIRKIVGDQLFDHIHLSGKVEVPVPKKIVDKFKSKLGAFKTLLENNTFQEWIGTIAAVLVAEALGFQSTELGVSYRGFDGVLWDPKFGRFVLIESKGGSSTLNANQMRDSWITPRLNRLKDKYAGTKDGKKLATELATGASFWALVVKLDLNDKTPSMAVKFQTYKGVKAWGKPFE